MKNAWQWTREHVIALLAALAAILLGVLAWGTYDRKMGRLKDTVKVERAMTKIAKLEAKRAPLDAVEEVLVEKDAELELEITDAKREVVEAREEVKVRTNAEVVSRFNTLYPPR